jgi:hypothetical protein
VIAGWSLVLAAREMGLSEIPLVTLTELSDGQARMLRLALNCGVRRVFFENA